MPAPAVLQGQFICAIDRVRVGAVAMRRRVIPARRESRRDLQYTGALDGCLDAYSCVVACSVSHRFCDLFSLNLRALLLHSTFSTVTERIHQWTRYNK